MAPGEQFAELPRAFQRGEVGPFLAIQIAAVERPLGFVAVLAHGAMDQGQAVFGEVRGDARVDVFDLAGLALEGRVQTAAEHAQVAAVEHAAGLHAAGELGEKAVAVGQLVDQRAALNTGLTHLPLAAAVEQRQLARAPAPALGQAFEQQALPAFAAPAGRQAEFLTDLQVQAAADQLQALQFMAGAEVFLQATVDDDVRVQVVEVELVAKHRLLEAQAQALDLRVLAGIHLGEQQLEHRFVRRLDALEQLPHAGAEKLAGWNPRQVAEVEHIGLADKAFAQQGVGVLGVARLFIHRHQPPQRRAPAEPDGGAIELVQQQVMLGGAAVVGGQLGFAITDGKARRVDQKAVHLGALGGRPAFQQAAFALQLLQGAGRQVRRMADPQVHVALLGLGHGAQAAHQEQAVNRQRGIATVGFVGERAGQALGFAEQRVVRLEARQPGRCAAADIAR